MDLLQSKKKLIGAVIFIAAIGFLLLIRFSVFDRKPSFERVLKYMVSELNKTYPQEVDKDTRLDSASVHPNKRFRYNYTMLFDKDSIEVEMYAISAKPLMLDNVRSNPDLQFLKDNNVIFEYYFRDIKGDLVTRIEVSPDEYVTTKEYSN